MIPASMSLPHCWPMLMLLADGAWHTGPRLAQTLGVSRATISLWAQEANHLGIQIEAKHRQGYRLPISAEWLSQMHLQETLAKQGSSWQIMVHPFLASTNTYLLSLAQQSDTDRMVVATEWQTSGRGRLGRNWLGQLGGSLLFSLAWRFSYSANQLAGLSLAVGLAMVQSLEKLGFSNVQLKWPNDLVWRQRKLGGVLIELLGDSLGPSLAVIGIGLNTNLALTPAQQDDIGQTVTDLAMIAKAELSHQQQTLFYHRNVILLAFLAQLEIVLTQFAQHGFSALQSTWEEYHAYAGQEVVLHAPTGEAVSGTVLGVNAQGALLLERNGKQQTIWSGDLSLRPMKSCSSEHSV